ncbi:hypothetical protein [Actinomadura rupiterrae]|uniref:hypothetical protein n=1 Tax=Actinomadura rupiterrae TaxID=559627 RepID=UPI0020A27C69|nr:hypothetical protein [Actinomadura rupiterrae]MCP2339117.1 Mce-associated membrane protein [Actinomadura rupiterrae]
MTSIVDIDEETTEEPATRPRRPYATLAAALVLALAGCGLFALHDTARGGPVSSNRALLDTDATTKAIGDVSDALARVFTYGPDDTANAERAAADTLTGRAAADYKRLFSVVKQQAPQQRLALRTRVVRAGLVSLTGHTAHLVVFLDQTATRAGQPAGTPAPAQLAVTAELHDGQWRISVLKSL